jgi:hypothetical protein
VHIAQVISQFSWSLVEVIMEEDAFITALPLEATALRKKKKPNDVLEYVRRDHSRLMDVVREFGGKVSTM